MLPITSVTDQIFQIIRLDLRLVITNQRSITNHPTILRAHFTSLLEPSSHSLATPPALAIAAAIPIIHFRLITQTTCC